VLPAHQPHIRATGKQVRSCSGNPEHRSVVPLRHLARLACQGFSLDWNANRGIQASHHIPIPATPLMMENRVARNPMIAR